MAYTTINKSTDYFNTKLYTGTGTSHNITGVGFQPDWVWVKNRDINTDAPTIYDAVRGATKRLQTSSTGAESTKTNGLIAFGSDGYTAGSASAINANGSNLVSWNWLGANGTTTNYDGSITSTVSANQTAGFSIVSYTGTGSNATVGHGLGSTPKMIIAKCLDNAKHWLVFHNSLDTNKNLYLNLTNAEDTPSPEIYRKGSFTDNVFAIGTHDRINASSQSMIAYCFAEKKGYSKFGSYTGNGSSDGTFVYTGFKPAFLIAKRTNAASSWGMWDSKRDPINQMSKALFPDLSNAEGTDYYVDFLSNGFKWRLGGSGENASGNTYIFMAFGQSLVGSNNVPCTAR